MTMPDSEITEYKGQPIADMTPDQLAAALKEMLAEYNTPLMRDIIARGRKSLINREPR